MSNAVRDDFFERAVIRLVCPVPHGRLTEQRAPGARNGRITRRARVLPYFGMEREGGPGTSIRAVERRTITTLNVAWSDPCAGHFAEQQWLRALARFDTVFVLSGVAIFKGDVVYRPRACGTSIPKNSHWMILASEIEHLPLACPLQTTSP